MNSTLIRDQATEKNACGSSRNDQALRVNKRNEKEGRVGIMRRNPTNERVKSVRRRAQFH
jgi:hypothetical protein